MAKGSSKGSAKPILKIEVSVQVRRTLSDFRTCLMLKPKSFTLAKCVAPLG